MTLATDQESAIPKTVLAVQPRASFVETESTREVMRRALTYLQAGFPVHFRGQAGTGKTTLAMHVAAQLGRPVMLIAGDEQFDSSDLIGKQNGYRYRRVVDRYIHSVLKYEENATQSWVDQRLTTACREGFTLVYDEFTRSRPEANNVLLSVLEERLLVLPNAGASQSYLKVHPQFHAIFTSNPQEYAGVHKIQDALSDRLVTMDIDYFDRATEISITAARAELDPARVARIVDLVRDYRASGEYDQTPTMRSCIMIAKVVAQQATEPTAADARFVAVCLDVLGSKTISASTASQQRSQQRALLLSLIARHCR